MQLAPIDWTIISTYFVVVLVIGILSGKMAGRSVSQFFLGGRKMPWWLLGLSMVATTFSTDTPNLVTDIVRQNGVSGNWVWWAFLISGMLTVFLFSKLWRRSEVLTDIEFYELRYSGKSAAFLRGFRALYLGIFYNVLIIAAISLSAIKIGGVLLGLSPLQSILWAAMVTVVFSSIGGFRGIVITDFLLFFLAMVGSIAAAYFAISHEQIGSLSNLLNHPDIVDKLSFFPSVERDSNGSWTSESLNLWITVMFMPLFVQWWSVWYPGSEPGGGGFIAQRMLAAKNERDSKLAVLFFNVAHYGLRPWPWMLVALASLIVYPSLESIHTAFPHLDENILGHDLAYSAMLTFLPTGWMGLVLASLVAAYMSTVSTLLNWGASYITHDFYERFVNRDASEKQLVRVGRIATVGLMVAGGALALELQSALDTFQILLQVGAGTGLLFMLRWFWWRINAFSELSAMIGSFVIAVFFKVIDPGWDWWVELVVSVALTTVIWILVTIMTPKVSHEKLDAFYKKVQPGGPGWKPFQGQDGASSRSSLLMPVTKSLVAVVVVLATLFGVGKVIYGDYLIATGLLLLAAVPTPWLLSTKDDNSESPEREG